MGPPLDITKEPNLWSRMNNLVVDEEMCFMSDILHSLMQSDGNSFGGDVVLKSVKIASSFEDSIYEDFKF